MKNFLRFLLMLLAFAPLAMQAQFTATFGTGNSATSTGGAAGAPMSYGGAYSWCQQIYRAAEFTAAGVPAGGEGYPQGGGADGGAWRSTATRPSPRAEPDDCIGAIRSGRMVRLAGIEPTTFSSGG